MTDVVFADDRSRGSNRFWSNYNQEDYMLFRLGTVAALFAILASAQESAVDHFEKKIRPVLASRCYTCHSTSCRAPQGGLLLDSAGGIRKGGSSGAVIQPGDPEHSLLIRAIRHPDKNLKMPPGGRCLLKSSPTSRLGFAREPRYLRIVFATAKKQSALWSLTKPRCRPFRR